VALSLQHLFSPTLINNARVGLTRTYGGNSIDVNPHVPQISDPAFGFTPGKLSGQISVGGVATGNVIGIPAGIGATGENLFGYTAPQAYDDLSWTKGRHSIRTGFNFEHVMYNLYGPFKPLRSHSWGRAGGKGEMVR